VENLPTLSIAPAGPPEHFAYPHIQLQTTLLIDVREQSLLDFEVAQPQVEI
jgi:hypothetical protein